MPDKDDSKEFLERLVAALKASESTVKAVIQDKNATAEKLTTLEVKLENIEEDVKALLHAVKGNGQEGLQTRMSLAEDHIRGLESDREANAANARGRWIVWAAAISGVAGLITAVATALLGQ